MNIRTYRAAIAIAAKNSREKCLFAGENYQEYEQCADNWLPGPSDTEWQDHEQQYNCLMLSVFYIFTIYKGMTKNIFRCLHPTCLV